MINVGGNGPIGSQGPNYGRVNIMHVNKGDTGVSQNSLPSYIPNQSHGLTNVGGNGPIGSQGPNYGKVNIMHVNTNHQTPHQGGINNSIKYTGESQKMNYLPPIPNRSYGVSGPMINVGGSGKIGSQGINKGTINMAG